MSINTPVCDGIAAAPGRYLLRRWLETAKHQPNYRELCLDIEHIKGYLDCLDDLKLITDTEWKATRAELNQLQAEVLA